MKLPPYIEFNVKDKNDLNDYYVLDSQSGHFAQRTAVSQQVATMAASGLDPKGSVQIAGYNVFLLFKGSLPSPSLYHSFARFSGKPDGEIQKCLQAMGEWYLANVIGQRLHEFESFRL